MGIVRALGSVLIAVTLLLATAPMVGAGASQGGTLSGAPAASFPQAPLSQQAQGKTTFDQKCASCHTIGGGKRVGPDLKGVTDTRPRDWLVKTITDPGSLSSDPTTQQLVQEYGMIMPNVGVTTAQADELLAYIQAQSGGQPAQQAQPAAPLPAGNAAVGRAIFTGGRRLSGGGPACMACHNAEGLGELRGGTWGLDLTKAHTKFGADGVAGILKAPAFPGMKEAYANAPITDQETADVVAFLAAVDQQNQQAGLSGGTTFPLLGLGAFVLLAILGQLIWRNRLRRVREPLVVETMKRRRK